VQADVRVTLEDVDEGTTRLGYDADAVVGGMIGGVGQRVLTGVAKKTAGEFFSAVDDVLNGRAPVAEASAGAAPAEAGVFRAPTPGGGAGGIGSPDFVKGAVFGALVALLGALVGALGARRRG
jgi:hypothetical protein